MDIEALKGSKDLQEEMAAALQSLAVRTARLSSLISKLIRDGHVTQSQDQLLAGFRMTREFSEAARVILEGHGITIFPDNPDNNVGVVEPGTIPIAKAEISMRAQEHLKPTTFAELLRQKVDDLIPKDRQEFRIADMSSPLKYMRGLSKKLTTFGLDSKKLVNRGEVANFLLDFLTTPTDPNFEPQNLYSRSKIYQLFNVKAPQLSRWSAEIGFNWSRSTKVDLTTALQLRGLAHFERIHPLQS